MDLQIRRFLRQAGRQFVLTSPGHPDLKATRTGKVISIGDSQHRHQLLGFRIDNDSRQALVSGAIYAIHPQNTNAGYSWHVRENISLQAGGGGN